MRRRSLPSSSILLALAFLSRASLSAAVTPDQLQCFKIKDAAAKAAYSADLTPDDETFAAAAGCRIQVPAKLLCVDSAASNVVPAPPGSSGSGAARQYLCYKTKCPPSAGAATAADEFGGHPLTVKSTSLVCAPLSTPVHCLDTVVSGDESDADCGGGCAACALGRSCDVAADCDSGACVMGACVASSCSDGVRNGDETGTDCGGGCPSCAICDECAANADCVSGVCTGGECQVPSCGDSVKNGHETGVDCGGSECPDCPLGEGCAAGSDCGSSNCIASVCRFPSCSDSVKNGSETDTDCGGACAACANPDDCIGDADCASRFCSGGSCSVCASNGDCGSGDWCSTGTCTPLLGAACASAASCPGGHCVDGVCCDSACDGACEACTFVKTLSTADGTCAPVASGIDPDAECGGTDVCSASSCVATIVAGEAAAAPARMDSCGDPLGRSCESLAGDVVADAMRSSYAADFAIVNGGAIRADLACPGSGNQVCDAYTPPPYEITLGQVAALAPFGDIGVTVTVTGDLLRLMLENGLSTELGTGRFPQVSGLCLGYDVAAAQGSRLLSVVRQAMDGSCTGPTVDLGLGSTYVVAENLFMAGGGDGYPNLKAGAALQGSIVSMLGSYVADHSPLAPQVDGRLLCSDSNGAAAPNCP